VITSDVVVCGAGVIGCAVARELAGAGLRVLVLEKGRPGEEASSAAAGLLTAQSDAHSPGPFVELGRKSLALFRPLSEELAEETGINIEFRQCGSLRVAGGEGDEQEVSAAYFWQKKAGWAVEPADAARMAEITGGLISRSFRSGVFFREEGIVDNERLVRALWFSAEKRGVVFLLGSPAVSVRLAGGVCAGVETERERIDAPIVINAAGSWAAFDRGLPFPIPVRPARGQIVELAAAGPIPPCTLRMKEFYIAPRSDGRLLLGSTVEFVGFEKKVTAEAMRRLLSNGLELVPGFSDARFSRAWAGLRPATPDSLPILGETPIKGLLMAAGHFRSGILLAPLTARILAAVVQGRDAGVDLAPYRLERFAAAFDPDVTGRFRFTEPK
jgi:glycine oxidase